MELYAGNLLRFATFKVSDRSICEDLVQEAFIVLFEKLDNVEEDKVKAFLFQVVSNKIKDYYKLKKNKVEVQPYHQITDGGENTLDAKDLVKKALRLMPEVERELIILRDLEGYDYKEISDITKLSLSQVKVYLFRARKKLKNTVLKMEVSYDRY